MTTLRVLVAAGALDAGVPWALYDDAGACAATGHDAPARWPPADALEIVVGAALVRLASIALPPVAPARLAAAAAFALEDRIAGASGDQWLVPSPRRVRERVVVAIVGRAQLDAIRAWASAAASLRLARVVAEPELMPVDADARWCVPDALECGTGFVRMPDGSAFPVDRRASDGALPAELALALAARDGDRHAFGSLVRRHQDRLFRYLHRMTGSRDDALDLTQEAFVRAWGALPGWRPEARFSTWLFQIARNAALDVLRRRGTVEVDAGVELPDVADYAADPLRRVDAAQQLERLEDALGTLSAEHREILIMRDIEDLPYGEIAALLGLTDGTVKSRLARARASLVAKLAEAAGAKQGDIDRRRSGIDGNARR